MHRSKYLVPSKRDEQWGLAVNTVGYEEIGPGEEYPQRGHADGYFFNIEEGRTLDEFQLHYITEGGCIFQSEHHEPVELHEGNIFLLFPGEWHTYHPLPDTGWKSYWIGFQGRNMSDRLRAGFFQVGKPTLYIGYSTEVIHLYIMALDTAKTESANYQQILAGIVNQLIGQMYALERNIILDRVHKRADLVARAQLRIREALESKLTIQDVAEELGMSYSNFRKLFKEYTATSPATYQQELRLQRAKELLTATTLSVKEIAYRLNFDSPDYFSAKFKMKTGRKPSQYRGD